MRFQLRKRTAAALAQYSGAIEAVATFWVVTRLLACQAAFLLPAMTWSTLIPLPSTSIFIITLAILVLNSLSASTDAAKLVDWLKRGMPGAITCFFAGRRVTTKWHERALGQFNTSLRYSAYIAIPTITYFADLTQTSMTDAILFHLPALVVSLTTLLLSPMPLGSYSPHWFPIAAKLILAHLWRRLMSHAIRKFRKLEWRSIVNDRRWQGFARLLWIAGRINASLIWQLPAFMIFFHIISRRWPTNAGTWISAMCVIVMGAWTAYAATVAAISDWERIETAAHSRRGWLECDGVLGSMFASVFGDSVQRSKLEANANLGITFVPTVVALVVGRATHSLPIACTFLVFMLYSQLHAAAWSHSCLRMAYPPEPPDEERPPDEIVAGATWTSEERLTAISEGIKLRAQHLLEGD